MAQERSGAQSAGNASAFVRAALGSARKLALLPCLERRRPRLLRAPCPNPNADFGLFILGLARGIFQGSQKRVARNKFDGKTHR